MALGDKSIITLLLLGVAVAVGIILGSTILIAAGAVILAVIFLAMVGHGGLAVFALGGGEQGIEDDYSDGEYEDSEGYDEYQEDYDDGHYEEYHGPEYVEEDNYPEEEEY